MGLNPPLAAPFFAFRGPRESFDPSKMGRLLRDKYRHVRTPLRFLFRRDAGAVRISGMKRRNGHGYQKLVPVPKHNSRPGELEPADGPPALVIGFNPPTAAHR